MSPRDSNAYSDDIFADTRMSFGDHLEDLRTHLMRALLGFVFFVVISFFPFIGKNVMRFISHPVEVELARYWDRYYNVRSREVLNELRRGDEALTSRNRPLPVRLKLNRRQFFEALGLKDPQKPREDSFDLYAAIEPLADRLDIGDWLPPSKRSSGRWVELDAEVLNGLELSASMTRNQGVVGRQPALATLNVQEAFVVYIKVCAVTGFVLASPWVFYQLWSFVAAGLYPHEKRYVNVYLPFSVGLFLIGVVVCELFVIPRAIEALLWFNEWLGLEPELRLSEWLGFAIFMPLVFGLSFQTPLVMLFLDRMNILSVDTYRRTRKIAYFILCVFASIVTPSFDAFSVILLWLPMCLLYELGIWLCRWMPRRPSFELEVPEGEEMVEV